MRPRYIVLAFAMVGALGFGGGYLMQQRQRQRAVHAERALTEGRAQAEALRQAVIADMPAPAPPAPAPSAASVAGPDEDEEEAAYRDLVAKRALTENCLICHEEGMFTGQRLTAAQWKAEVDKMIGWGAMLPDVDREPVEEYLSRHFGDKAATPPPGRAALADLSARETPGDGPSASGDATKGGQLFTIVCASCHGPTGLGSEQGLGPALAGRAPLMHAAYFHETLEKGLRKMPAMNTMLSVEQRGDILAWLRAQDRDASSKP